MVHTAPGTVENPGYVSCRYLPQTACLEMPASTSPGSVGKDGYISRLATSPANTRPVKLDDEDTNNHTIWNQPWEATRNPIADATFTASSCKFLVVAVSRTVSDLAVSETPCVDHAGCGTPPHAVAPIFCPVSQCPRPEPTPTGTHTSASQPRTGCCPHLLRANQPTISESGHLPRPSVSNHISAPRPEPESVGFFGTHGRCSLGAFFCERRKRCNGKGTATRNETKANGQRAETTSHKRKRRSEG